MLWELEDLLLLLIIELNKIILAYIYMVDEENTNTNNCLH